MATVYIARESSVSGLRRTVALKVMHEHLTRNERFKKRFLDEARVLTHITHPYVCRVLGFGDEGGRPYMAMEYLVGEPLSRVLKAMKRRVDGLSCAVRTRLFARVIADIAEGMHAAHECCNPQGRPLGVVHRDISPQNLFLLYDGTVRILDFGIARYRDRYVQTATTGRLIGKLPYMAPEQILGQAYDRRVDVWALGIVLWELVTLDRLFRRETEVRTMEAVCSDPIPRASEVAEGIPPGFDEILARALERDPERRYQTAAELAHDLEHWLAKTGQPVTHADLGEFLAGFFPGSQKERQRWAEESVPECETIPRDGEGARDVVSMIEESGPSLTLPKHLPRTDELVTAELTPTLSYTPRKQEVEGSTPNTISEPPDTHASPVAISITGATVAARDRSAKVAAIGIPLVVMGLGIAAAFGPGRRSAQPSVDLPVPAAQPAFTTELAPPMSFEAVPFDPLHSNPRSSNTVRSDVAAPQRWVAPPEKRAGSTTERKNEPNVGARVGLEAADKNAMSNGAAPALAPQLGSGDVLVQSSTPGLYVYHGAQLLGQTPLRTRLPAGQARLFIQFGKGGARTPLSAKVVAGQLNIVTLR